MGLLYFCLELDSDSGIFLYLDGRLDNEVGCFVYSSNFNQHRSYQFLDDESLTVDYCLDYCMEFAMKFSILDNGRYCSCSNTLPPSKNVVSNSQCSVPCSGEPGTEGKCGGTYRWNFYAVTF